MKYVIPNFNLDAIIDSAWDKHSKQQQSSIELRERACAEVKKVYADLFQADLNRVISAEIQKNLNFAIIKSVDLEGVYARFEYVNVVFELKRFWQFEVMHWQIIKMGESILCNGSYLETQLLIELALIKNHEH